MTKLFCLALIPLLSVAVRAQTPAPDPSRLADVERTDRAFLSGLESQPVAAPKPTLPPSPPPVAAAPAPQATVSQQTTVTTPVTVAPAPKVAAVPHGVTTIELARPAAPVKTAPVKAAPAKPKAKSTVATTRQRSTPERRVTVSRKYADEPVYRGIPVMDPPEVARVERRSGLFFRPVEVRRPVVVRKVTTTTVTSRERDDDDDRDEDEDDD